ncbi:uncharacterized protein FOMMEDRAFT_160577 [Fomitiporia mediterranea MF3/22]|uniref:uncharacterized protein n=1 Tax=Fomitiporia mediterranea (strain MF3/22) TaxID=694068 RepID=UPI00044083FF|nr:uncharacterized protein FOMMEDRAFT_160577 [Fomitiporia mediterranea MF3/22]EJC99508.1 hypothetical protein FOMMEDRAFT_160577 [Fomitiporia mediterranea MF3/22]
MSHHVVGFSDFATSPCRSNAYEFPIIFAVIVTAPCLASQKPTPNWASLLYYYRENGAFSRTGSAKQRESKEETRDTNTDTSTSTEQVEDKNYWRKVEEGLSGAVATAKGREKRAESDEGLSPTLFRRPVVVQLAIASEDTVGLLICISEDSDKWRIALERQYIAGSRRSADHGRFQSLWTHYRHPD